VKQGIKRTIAREGLIILALCLLSVTMICLDHLQEAGKFGTELPDAYVDLPKIYVDIDRDLSVLFPKGTDEKIMCEVLKRDFAVKCRNVVQLNDTDVSPDRHPVSEVQTKDPSDVTHFARPAHLVDKYFGIPYGSDGYRVEKKLVYRISFFSYYIFFSLIAYPSYWIVRFVIWSVKTLRTKEDMK